MSSVQTVCLTPEQGKSAIRSMVKVNLNNAKLGKKRRGLFMWGPPGVAKSSITEQICRELNYKLIDVRLIQMDPTDLRGLPVPQKSAENPAEVLVRWAVPSFFPRKEEGSDYAIIKKKDGTTYDGAIILLDELPNAAPTVQAASYQLVLDGALGDYELPNNVIVMAAGNREIDQSSTFKMPLPLQNRFTHIEIKSSFEDWQRHAITHGFDSSVVGFLSAFNHHLNIDSYSKVNTRGFTTPRSWETASDILRDCADDDAFILQSLIGGTIGEGVASEFFTYRALTFDLPAAADILDGKVKTLPNQDGKIKTNLSFALATSLCYELKARYDASVGKSSNSKEVKHLNDSFDNFLAFCMDNFKKEIVVMAVRTAISTFNIMPDIVALKVWDRFNAEFEDVLL